MLRQRSGRVRTCRAVSRDMRNAFGWAMYGDKSTQGRILLAHFKTRRTFLHLKVSRMLEVQTFTHFTNRRTTSDYYTMVFHHIGNGYSRTLSHCKGSSEISYSCHRLFHKMDRSRALSNYHCPTSTEVYMEECYLQTWTPALLSHR